VSVSDSGMGTCGIWCEGGVTGRGVGTRTSEFSVKRIVLMCHS
jgi:hypothetical protein